MTFNIFKTIRKSYITGTLLTGLLSNVIVFGQPIQQMSQRANQLEAIKLSNGAYLDSYNRLISNNYNETPNTSNTKEEAKYEVLNSTVTKKGTTKKNTATVFYAIEEQGVIGMSSATDTENPRDNFFTLMLPQTLNLNDYDVVLKYKLYGLEDAQYTTKSINNSMVYGGQAVKLNDEWKLVKEYIPTQYIKEGKNEIFFNRRADKNYLYKIKDLSIELIKKRAGTIFITQKKLINFNGNIHLLGYVTDNSNQIEVFGQTIPITNGVFETILKEVSRDLKTLKIKYGVNKSLSKEFDIEVKEEVLNHIFSKTSTNEISSVTHKNMLGILSLDALTIEDIANKSEFTESNLRIKGIEFDELRPLNNDVKNVTSGKFLGYRLTTIKKKDSSTVKLHLKYDDAKIPDGYSDKDVRTFSFDKEKREWIALPVDSLDYENKVVISDFNGDTDYINGIIKVPEMAETSSFTPTTISDMEYANPATGVVSISPPSPNAMGSATTGFPIKLPKGRNGMMPSLGLNYSSEAGNGWMGLGWNLQLPAISLDTRWGTPRFKEDVESEIYQLNGETMVMKVGNEYTNPQRNSNDIFRSNNRTFYLRKEGSYLKIQRLGNSPTNYSWEVTDKYGNKSIYGSTDDSKITQTPTGGAITHWALKKTIDPFGNYVEYEYDKGEVNPNDINGVIKAQFFYPKRIRYTLKEGSTSHYYQVDFKRNSYTTDGGGTITDRPDIGLNARSGSMMAITDLLTEIKIGYFDGSIQPIRTYQFNYDESAFEKTQLSKISEYDTEQKLFYNNTIEYFNDIVTDNYLVSNTSTNWESDENGNNGSPLQSGSTSGFSVGLRVGVGIGFKATNVTNTIGGSYNYSQNKEKTKISFIDINGDGLLDKVYKEGTGLKYLPNLGIGNGFGGSIFISNISDLDASKSRTNTFGYDANIGVNSFGVGVGKGHSKTRTSTSGYFTDFNGDGLPDVVDGSIIKFNSTNPWEEDNYPIIQFNSNSNSTKNEIYPGNVNDSIIGDLDLETKEELRSDHPQFDHVKAWQAPYTGSIKIENIATLLQSNICDNEGYINSFRLTIEKATANQTSGITSKISIGVSDEWYLSSTNSSVQFNKINLSINKGDKLFFRIHNTEYGCGGEVKWNPKITYSTTDENIYNSIDEHGKNYVVYNPEDDFILNNGGTWSPNPGDNSINFNTNFGLSVSQLNSLNLSDEVRFVVEKIRYEHSLVPSNFGEIISEEPFRRTLIYNTNGNLFPEPLTDSPNTIKDISNQFINGGHFSYEFRFYVESDSNVQWDKINWQPIITSQPNSETYYPSVSYKTYENNINQVNYEFATDLSTSPTIQIDPNVSGDENTKVFRIKHNAFDGLDYSQFNNLNDNEFPVQIDWVVKQKVIGVTSKLSSEQFFVSRSCSGNPPFTPYTCNYIFKDENGNTIDTNNVLQQHFFQFELTKQEAINIRDNSGKIYSQFYIDNERFGENSPIDISIDLHPDQQANYTFNSVDLEHPFMAENVTFYGTTYRGWGQFLYNGGLKYHYTNDGEIDDQVPVDNFDGNIDMSVFDYAAHPQNIENQIEGSTPPNQNEAIRYVFYSNDNQDNSYINKTIISRVNEGTGEKTPAQYKFTNGELTSWVGRFGEPNILDLYLSEAELGLTPSSNQPFLFVGLQQRSLSKGTASYEDLSAEGFSGSGTFSDGTSKVLNQYIDLNGDRYPDMVTKNKIQLTSMQGGLSNNTEDIVDNNFVSGSESEDNTLGVTISGVMPNSTSSDNMNNTNTNVNSGINTSEGNSFNARQWNDINGDGLTDQVKITKTAVKVKLNLGFRNSEYEFSDEIIWSSDLNLQNLDVSRRGNVGGGGGFHNASYAAGIGVAESTATLNASLIDVNGDGLPDLVERTGTDLNTEYRFYLNNGIKFENSPQMFYNGLVDRNSSVTENVFGSYTNGRVFKMPILPPPLFIPIKVTGTATASASTGTNEKQVTVQDIDGDGYPDVLEQGNNNGVIVAHLNKIGKTHRIKSVNTPLGGSWTVDYKREGNTYNTPQNKWVLSEIRTNDGFEGDNNYASDKTFTTVDYENPNHDRREREFLGFEKVKVFQKDPSNEHDFRYSLTEYHNENIYLKGLQKRTALYDANDAENPLSESITIYNIMDADNPVTNLNPNEANQYLQAGLNLSNLDHDRLFVAPVKTISTTYEGTDALSLEQDFTNYDNHGNLLAYKKLGDTYTSSGINDAYKTVIEYYSNQEISGIENSTGFAKKVSVFKDNNNELLRQRFAEYTSQGKLSKVITTLNENDNNVVELFYDDSYGNLTKSKLQNGFETIIHYDTPLHTFPIDITNSLGEQTFISYNYLFGTPVYTKDVNTKTLVTRIDNRGRPIEVISPNEFYEDSGNNWTIRMQYPGENASLPPFQGLNDYMLLAKGHFSAIDVGNSTPTSAKHFAVTRHNVKNYNEDTFSELQTVSLVDGFGQAIQLKKMVFGENQLKWLISGKEQKDPFGRVLKAYLPTTKLLSYPLENYDNSQSAEAPPTTITYDIKDRALSVKQPGETTTATTNYSISDGMFLTTATNELGQVFEAYTDVRGRQRKTVQNNELTTQFYYNAVGEKIKVRNQQGYDTFYKYDLAGRRTEERHPDHGLQIFKYDHLGNLKERFTSNLLVNGGEASIRYEYDIKNRPIEIRYPNNPENNVNYTYGLPNNQDAKNQNAVGRLYIQEDASGVQGFAYDDLGNLNDHLRGVAVAGRHTFWYRTRWIYDSFNRVQQITYPDDEVVKYNYNNGGTLDNVTRTIAGTGVSNEPIIEGIDYSNLGERTHITYGNGTSTSYSYDNRRRLGGLTHHFGTSSFEVNNKYGYDALSNVTSIETGEIQGNLPGFGQLGGPIKHYYAYDDYNRLVSANGRYVGPNDLGSNLLAQEYTLNMKYDLAHNIINKEQTHIQGAVSDYNEAIANPEIITKTNYNLAYVGYATGTNVVQGDGEEFGYVQPHAPRVIIETPDHHELQNTDPNYKKKEIEYDANGNQLSVIQIVNDDEQAPAQLGVVEQQKMVLHKNIWDEEDRLRAVDLNPEEKDPHQLAVYTYDASGQRTVRYVPDRLDVKSNAKNVSANERDDVMLYPSGLISAKPMGKPGNNPQEGDLVSKYTKHYYVGSERINSRLGSTKDLGLYPNKTDPKFPGLRGLVNARMTKANAAMANTYGALGQSISLNSILEENMAKKTNRFSHDANANDAYWYHSDHLGSSSYITDVNGNVTQHMEYLPYGETLVEEHQNSYNTPFKFNAKELDDETGNYYYGARYYNPKFSIWLSVDPLAEFMPTFSSYNYNFSNPIKYHDPTGMAPEIWIPGVDDDGNVIYTKEEGDHYDTLMSQYGLSEDQAQEIWNRSGRGNKGYISGDIVEKVTGNEILKLDNISDKQKNLEQIAFAFRHDSSEENIVKFTDYFNISEDAPTSITIEGSGSLEINGSKIDVWTETRVLSERNANAFGCKKGGCYSVPYASATKSGKLENTTGTILGGGKKDYSMYKATSYLYFDGKRGNEKGYKEYYYQPFITLQKDGEVLKNYLENK